MDDIKLQLRKVNLQLDHAVLEAAGGDSSLLGKPDPSFGKSGSILHQDDPISEDFTRRSDSGYFWCREGYEFVYLASSAPKVSRFFV